jgi:hypothetical protein
MSRKAKNRFKPKDANEEYKRLAEYSKVRTEQIAPMLEPFLSVTEQYGRLLTRVMLIVARYPPESIQDRVVRDLMADVFDFLHESTPLVMKGQCLVAFPLARRAYESLSLLHWCVDDASAAERWANGKKFTNSDVRKAHAASDMGEPEEALQKLYKFFCEQTHPNRDMIGVRWLGEGNSSVFGSIGQPSLVILCDYAMKLLELWFWFCPVVAYFFRRQILETDPTFHEAHNQTRDRAQEVVRWLAEQFDAVLKEEQAIDRTNEAGFGELKT